jgi:hypothetical protein
MTTGTRIVPWTSAAPAHADATSTPPTVTTGMPRAATTTATPRTTAPASGRHRRHAGAASGAIRGFWDCDTALLDRVTGPGTGTCTRHHQQHPGSGAAILDGWWGAGGSGHSDLPGAAVAAPRPTAAGQCRHRTGFPRLPPWVGGDTSPHRPCAVNHARGPWAARGHHRGPQRRIVWPCPMTLVINKCLTPRCAAPGRPASPPAFPSGGSTRPPASPGGPPGLLLPRLALRWPQWVKDPSPGPVAAWPSRCGAWSSAVTPRCVT